MQSTIVAILATRSVRAAWCLGALLAPAAWAAEAPASPAPPRPAFEGAIGLQYNNTPEFTGSDLRKNSLAPGLYLRWGRFSVATASNFVNRHDDEVIRGVGADLLQSDHVRVQLGLRYDPGRPASTSAALALFDPVRSTLRARLALVWQPTPAWRLGAGWNNDLLGRKGGALVDFSVGREFRLSQRTRWSLGSGITWADERYMMGRFGVGPEAAQRTGKPAYVPGAGWRDIGLSTQLRTDIDKRWSVWAGGGVSRLLGPTLDSPLVLRASAANAGAGFAWRF